MSTHKDHSARRWRATSPTDLRWAAWDEDFVVYHAAAGRTHLLNAASELLITRVLDEPQTARQATERFARMQGIVASDEVCAKIAALLEHLDELGLIEAA